MEIEGIVPKERVYVCADCISEMIKFMLANPKLLKSQNLPSTLTAYPVETGNVEPCEYCNSHIATGFIPCFPSRE